MTSGALLLVIIALGLGGISKGATGMGLPIIATPILALYFGIPQAVAIMTMPIIVTNCWQIYAHRRNLGELRFLLPMLVGGVVGIALGTVVIYAAPKQLLAGLLAFLLCIYIARRLWSPGAALRREVGVRIAPLVGVAAGILQGSTGISSPVLVPFLHSLRLERGTHVAGVSLVFLTLSLTQLPALTLAGFMTWPLLLQSLLALIPTLAFMPVGAWLGSIASAQMFDRAILMLLSVTVLQLAWQATEGSLH